MESTQTLSLHKTFSRFSKDVVLSIFKASRHPIPSFQPLVESLSDIFSKVPLEPENYLPQQELNPADIFIEAAATPKPMRLVTQKKITIQKSPFTSSGYVEDPTLRVWYYLDDSNNVQGPFTSIEMDHWFDNDFLSHELMIRLKEKNDFVKLINLFGKTEISQYYKPSPTPTRIDQSPYYASGEQGIPSSGTKREGQLSNSRQTFYTFEFDTEKTTVSPTRQNKPTYSFDTNGTNMSLTPNDKSPTRGFSRNTAGTPLGPSGDQKPKQF